MYFGIVRYICYILTHLRLTHLKYPSDPIFVATCKTSLRTYIGPSTWLDGFKK